MGKLLEGTEGAQRAGADESPLLEKDRSDDDEQVVLAALHPAAAATVSGEVQAAPWAAEVEGTPPLRPAVTAQPPVGIVSNTIYASGHELRLV